MPNDEHRAAESVERVKVIEAKDGDIFVVTADYPIGEGQHERIMRYWSNVIRAAGLKKCGLAVLDRGLDVKVLRPNDSEVAHDA